MLESTLEAVGFEVATVKGSKPCVAECAPRQLDRTSIPPLGDLDNEPTIGRGRGIRTPGPLLPKQVLYQAELCPDT